MALVPSLPSQNPPAQSTDILDGQGPFPPINLPASVQAIAQGAMATALKRTDLMREVEALAGTAIRINQDFERVRVGLSLVDKCKFRYRAGNPVEKFQPDWVGFQSRWTELLWGSRDTATAAEAYIKDFLEVIVPELEDIRGKEDLPDAKLDLEAFIKRTPPFWSFWGKKEPQLNPQQAVGSAEKYSKDFDDLRGEIDVFRNSFEDFVHDYATGLLQNAPEQQEDLQTKLQELGQGIQRCTSSIRNLWTALGATVFGTAVFGVLAAVLAPTTVVGIVIVGATAAIGELTALYVKSKERDDLEALVARLELTRDDLERQTSDMARICNSLNAFSKIWAIVRHDAKKILDDLNAAVGDQGSQKGFKRRVSVLKESYTALSEALRLYATQVQS